jgi:hypothetical protein
MKIIQIIIITYSISFMCSVFGAVDISICKKNYGPISYPNAQCCRIEKTKRYYPCIHTKIHNRNIKVDYKRTIIPKEALLHMISIDSRGRYIPLKANSIITIKDGSLYEEENQNNTCQNDSYEKYMHAILNNIDVYAQKNNQGSKENPIRILLFAHGGLNSLRVSVKRAISYYPEILHDPQESYYPIFINWKSGPLGSIGQTIFKIRDGDEYPVLGPITSPLYLGGKLLEGIGRAPIVWSEQLINSINHKAYNHNPNSTLCKMSHIYCTDNDLLEWPKKIRAGIKFIITSPFKIVTTPFAESFGKDAWKNMIRRTMNTFHRPVEFSHTEKGINAYNKHILNPCEKESIHKTGAGALARFMYKLSQKIQQEESRNQNKKYYAITLIGHSMGPIIINEILKKYPNIYYKNIVYMAAAASIRDTQNAVTQYLYKRNTLQKQKSHFYNLSLHPNAENNESYMHGLVPDGSLLVWIDDMYEYATVKTDKTMGRWKNIEDTINFFPAILQQKGYINFKVFSINDNGEPQTHGAFDEGVNEYSFWKKNFWWDKK